MSNVLYSIGNRLLIRPKIKISELIENNNNDQSISDEDEIGCPPVEKVLEFKTKDLSINDPKVL